MRIDVLTAQAALNNARWCNTVARSHEKPVEWRKEIWLNRRPAPPFYPNAVTLTPAGQTAQVAAIQELAQTLPGEFGVKDSFCTLDLAPLGGHVLFEAEWIYRRASLSISAGAITDWHWQQLKTLEALTVWEAAWQGENQDAAAARIFLPPLLADPTIAIFAAYRQQRIVAGVIANQTGEVVGLSNLFAPVGEEPACWVGAVASIHAAFPGLPMVGYEMGDSLTQAQAVGFIGIGSLRVWLKGVESQ